MQNQKKEFLAKLVPPHFNYQYHHTAQETSPELFSW